MKNTWNELTLKYWKREHPWGWRQRSNPPAGKAATDYRAPTPKNNSMKPAKPLHVPHSFFFDRLSIHHRLCFLLFLLLQLFLSFFHFYFFKWRDPLFCFKKIILLFNSTLNWNGINKFTFLQHHLVYCSVHSSFDLTLILNNIMFN